MSHPSIDDLVRRNEKHVATHEPLPYFPETKKRGHTLIISCADPRVVPENIFQLRPEDNEAAIFRTIAGHPQSALQGLVTLDVAFGVFKQIVILHHTDCGATYHTDEKLRAAVTARSPGHPEVEKWEFGMITGTIEQNLKEDLEWLRSHPLLSADLAKNTRGFMYDIKTGKLTEVQ